MFWTIIITLYLLINWVYIYHGRRKDLYDLWYERKYSKLFLFLLVIFPVNVGLFAFIALDEYLRPFEID